MSTFEKDIKHLLIELESKEVEYEELSKKGGENKDYFEGKEDAYRYSSNRIKRLLKWYGLID